MPVAHVTLSAVSIPALVLTALFALSPAYAQDADKDAPACLKAQ